MIPQIDVQLKDKSAIVNTGESYFHGQEHSYKNWSGKRAGLNQLYSNVTSNSYPDCFL